MLAEVTGESSDENYSEPEASLMRSGIRVASAVVTGRSHEKDGRPCQDKVSVWRASDKASACIALSDGAGSSLYSQLGAEFASRAVAPFLQEYFEMFFSDADLAKRLFTEYLREGLVEVASKNARDVSELSATLAFVYVKRRRDRTRYVVGHVGDGVVVSHSRKEITVLSHPFNGEYINTTEFINSPNLCKRLRLSSGAVSGSAGFMVMSDGTAESLYIRKLRQPNSVYCGEIFNWIGKYSSRRAKQILEHNLRSGVFREVSCDDCSIAIIRIC